MGCPEAALIQRYVDGACSVEDSATVETHAGRCAGCAAAIESAQADQSLLGDLRRAVGTRGMPVAASADFPSPERYRVVRRRGAGGMGVVYEAEQSNPRRRVALKVIRAGLATDSTRRRFELEAEALGRLEHPGIARVYEAGTYEVGGESQPFLVMEFVDGRRLDEWVAKHRPDRDRRLALFRRICAAVEHAHQRGVLHRDLKPANVLVTGSGEVKVVDFGVARLLDTDDAAAAPRTHADQLVGTLPYMSPEQVAGEATAVDVRSDVWSLGVMLFELLAERLPHDLQGMSRTAAIRTIAEHEPPRLRTVAPAVDRELELIVGTALRRDQQRRYASVAMLRGDLERFRRHEPIHARAPGRLYLIRKFVRRHRAFVGAGGLVLGALAIGLVLASQQRDRARLEAMRSAAVVDILKEILLQADPNQVRGDEPTISEAVREAEARMARHVPDDPWVAGTVWHTLGQVQLGLGRLDDAERNLDRAVGMFDAVEGGRKERAFVSRDLAMLALKRGRFEETERHASRTLELARALGLGPSLRAAAHNLAGLACLALQRLEDAERHLLESARLWRAAEGGAGANRANVLANLGLVQSRRGDLDAAVATYERCLSTLRETLDERHPLVAATLGKLGAARMKQQRFDEAERALRESLRLGEARLGDAHPELTETYLNLGTLLRRTGRAPDAVTVLRTGVAAARAGGATHPNVRAALERLAAAELAAGDAEAAVATLRQLRGFFDSTRDDAAAARVDRRIEDLEAASRGR